MTIFDLMNLFKFLKKKQADSFEELLKRAANQLSDREEFQKRILTEKLLLLTNTNIADGLVKLEIGTKINVFTVGDGRIPIFTSPERIYDKGIIKREMQFISASGKDIFIFLTGAKLILNPYSDYSKEFIPDEIERLLDGTYFKAKQIKIEKNVQIRIGQPAKYPTEVVTALVKLFSNRPDVISAYLGWMHDPSTLDPPHYIFAIETNGDWLSISDEAGSVVQKIIGYDEIIDFMQINHDGGLSDYFIKSNKPFFKKSK